MRSVASKSTWTVFVWLLFASCARQEVPGVESEEYEIYSIAIASVYGRSVNEQFQILNETVNDPIQDFQRIKRRETLLKAQTIRNYLARSKKTYTLERRLTLGAPFVLISRAQADAQQLTGMSPPGWIAVSRVGFDPARRQAFLYMMNCCGGLCGRGFFALLSRDAEGWKVEEVHGIWVS